MPLRPRDPAPAPVTRWPAVVAVLLVAAAVMSAAVTTSPASAAERRAVADRPPLRPEAVSFTVPVAPCATGEDRPYLRTTTPTFYSVLRDREGSSSTALRAVELTGTGWVPVWSTLSTPQASGVGRAVPIDVHTDGSEHGRTYRVQVRGVDSTGQVGPRVACEFEVDLVPPEAPSVVAVASGTQPVYLPGVPAGGVGRTGTFTLGTGGSTDVVQYRYSLGNSAFDLVADVASPTITVTPTTPGTTRLQVQSVDRAGWVSPTTTYDLIVSW